MSNRIAAALATSVGFAAYVFALAVGLQRLPGVLAGANLRVLTGRLADPHVLTGWFWPAYVAARHAPHGVFSANAAAFAIAVAVVAFAAARLRGPLAGALAGSALAVSPLANAIFADPLGAEGALALALFFVLAADAVDAIALPAAVRAALVAALVLQDPLYAPAALLYAAIVLLSGRGAFALLPVAGAAAACALRIAFRAGFGGAPGAPAVDALAAPPSLIAIGVLLFGALPLALFGVRRGVFTRAGFIAGRTGAALALCAAALAAAIFSWTGDPSGYWLAAQGALLLGLCAAAPAATRASAIAAGIAGALVIAELFAGARAAHLIPSVTIARQSLETAAAVKAARNSPVCVVADNPAQTHVLADGAFFDRFTSPGAKIRSAGSIRECPPAPAQHLVTLDRSGVTDWEGSGLTLARLTAAENRARFVLTDSAGDVFPKTRVNLPGGHGAFGNTEPTAVGGVTTMTVVAGFQYTYPCVDTAPSGTLEFVAANPIAEGDPAQLSVVVKSPGGAPRTVLRTIFRGHPQGRKPLWRAYRIRLGAPERCLAVTFKTEAPGGQQTGAWVTFAALIPPA